MTPLNLCIFSALNKAIAPWSSPICSLTIAKYYHQLIAISRVNFFISCHIFFLKEEEMTHSLAPYNTVPPIFWLKRDRQLNSTLNLSPRDLRSLSGLLKLELLAIDLNIVRLRSIDSVRLELYVMQDYRQGLVYRGAGRVYIVWGHCTISCLCQKILAVDRLNISMPSKHWQHWHKSVYTITCYKRRTRKGILPASEINK